MATILLKVVEHLYTGVIPKERELQELCGKVVIVYIALALHAEEIGEPITLHLVENGNADDESEKTSVIVSYINAVWTLRMLGDVAKVKDKIINATTFDKVGIFPLTETIEIYAAYKSLLRHPCSMCNEEYSSDINRVRCENSHVDKKKPDERTRLPIEQIEAFWDAASDNARKAVVEHAQTYFSGVSKNSVFPERVMKFLDVVSGNVDIGGRDLMIALDLASEYTFSWRIVRPLDTLTLVSRTDYVAAMAHSVIKRLAEAYAQDAAEKLLGETSGVAAKKKTKPKKPAAAAGVKKRMADVPCSECQERQEQRQECRSEWGFNEKRVMENIERQRQLEQKYAEGAYDGFIQRLEKSIFSVPAIRDVALWADME